MFYLMVIKRLNKCQWKNAPKKIRTISRTYGRILRSEEVKLRIMKAFFNEELKCIKKTIIVPKKK